MFDKKYITPSDALQLILESVSDRLPSETVRIEACLGRVVAEDIYSCIDLPGFVRSSVDGFAVKSADTFGAKETMPAYLTSSNEVTMGHNTLFELQKGEAALIPTGGMMPEGADAVVMFENVQVSPDSMIEILRPVVFGENVVQSDEDAKSGALIISRGRRLRPQDAGALAGLGFAEVAVVRRPLVSIISTGDEIVPYNCTPDPGQVRDINSLTLSGLIIEEGGIPLREGIFRDDYDSIRDALHMGLQESDIVLIVGGTSVGARDMTAKIIGNVCSSGILFHGVAIRPGRPLLCGIAGAKLVFGLPGHPGAVVTCFNSFIKPALDRLQGVDESRAFGRRLTAVMAKSVTSAAGREDHVRVRIRTGVNGYDADPVLGKSGMIMTLVRADGVVVIPPNKLGLDVGETVEVNLF